MKNLIGVIAAIVTFIALIWGVDGMIVGAVCDLFPASIAEWMPLIRFGLWVVVIFFTIGIATAVSALVGVIVSAVV